MTCKEISQEAGQVVWYSHLFQNFPQFLVIHTVKGFGIVNKAEVDVFLELSCFFHDPADVGNCLKICPYKTLNYKMKKSNFGLESPGKYHINQVMKVTVSNSTRQTEIVPRDRMQ